uniref:Claudin n=1 Tax=Sander lucioperca TaxID=283035 RepID=A0A8D0AIW8_SANLU
MCVWRSVDAKIRRRRNFDVDASTSSTCRVIIICSTPMWRVTAFIGSNIVTAQVIWEGIWTTCVVQSMGQMQCDAYDSMLALSTDVRALMVVSIVAGSAGILIAFAGGKCTNFIPGERAKARVSVTAGVFLIISGILCLIPVSWTATLVITDFYNPFLIDAQKRELGTSLYIGWVAGGLLVFGGALLCATCPSKEDETPPGEVPPKQTWGIYQRGFGPIFYTKQDVHLRFLKTAGPLQLSVLLNQVIKSKSLGLKGFVKMFFVVHVVRSQNSHQPDRSVLFSCYQAADQKAGGSHVSGLILLSQ